MKILVLYSSTDGHTTKICSFLTKKLQKNHLVEMTKINNDEKFNFSTYDFIIIGASIRYGSYRKIFLKFINENYFDLQKSTTAFFSVNIVAQKKKRIQSIPTHTLKSFINYLNGNQILLKCLQVN